MPIYSGSRRAATEIDPHPQFAETWEGAERSGDLGDTGVLSIEEYPLEPGIYLGEYRIEQFIAEGAMGKVFEGLQPTIGKRVAIKVIKSALCRDEVAVERFVDEARAANQIGHPNIVDIFAFGEMPDGRRYFVMEWLAGETLRAQLRRGKPALADAAHVVRTLARALEAAHHKGIIHRDVKPENVVVIDADDDLPVVKLLDFGIAKLANQAAAPAAAPHLLGTPMYIAPEQIRSADDVGWATDVYSLGCIAFELLTGRAPFAATTLTAMLARHLEEPPPAPSSLDPDVPEELDRLVLAMLAKDPIERPTLGHVRSVFDRVRSRISEPNLIVARTVTPAGGIDFSPPTDPGSLIVRFKSPRTGERPAQPRPHESGPVARPQVVSAPSSRRRAAWLAVIGAVIVIAAVAAFAAI